MLKVTHNAAKNIHSLLKEYREKDNQVLRLVPTKNDGFRFVLARKRRKDRAILHKGREIMVIGRKLDTLLEGMTLDLQRLPEGENLTLRSRQDQC